LKNIQKRKRYINIQTKIGKKNVFIDKAGADEKKMRGIANKGVTYLSYYLVLL